MIYKIYLYNWSTNWILKIALLNCSLRLLFIIDLHNQSSDWSLAFLQKNDIRKICFGISKLDHQLDLHYTYLKSLKLIFSLDLPNDTLDFDLQNEYQRSLRLIFSLDLPIRSLDFYYIFKTDLQFFFYLHINLSIL